MNIFLIWIIVFALFISTILLWYRSRKQKAKIDVLKGKISSDNDYLNAMHKTNESLIKKFNQLNELTLMVNSENPKVLQSIFEFVRKGGDTDQLLLDEQTQKKICLEIIQKETYSLIVTIFRNDGSKESFEQLLEYKLALNNKDCLVVLHYLKDTIRNIFQHRIKSIVIYSGIINLLNKIPNGRFLNTDVDDLVSQRITEISAINFEGVEKMILENAIGSSSAFQSMAEIIERRHLDPTKRLEFANKLRNHSKKYVTVMLSEHSREDPRNIEEAKIAQTIYNKYHL